MPKILVTGGAGFIGSHVVDAFVAEGYDVTVIDNLSTGKRENVSESAVLCEADVTSAEAADLVRSGSFDIIAHLAAQIDVRKSVDDPQFDASVNVLGTVRLAEAARQLPLEKRPRFIFASTGGALYGEATTLPTAEVAPKNPRAPYGVAKLCAESYLAYYALVWDMPTVTLRFGNVYGPRQDPSGEAGVVSIFAKALLRGDELKIFGDGTQTRDYVYVADVARAFLAAARCGLPAGGDLDARAFNVGTGRETSVLQLASLLKEVAATPCQITYLPARPGEVIRSALNVQKAKKELGWSAERSLLDGLGRTYHWIRRAHLAASAERD